MTLAEIYKKYKDIHKTLEAFLEKFVETKEEITSQSVIDVFEDTRLGIESLLDESVSLEVANEHEDDLKDLKYLMTDTLFLLMDLSDFCKYNEIGRCKMRVLNYLGKRKRTDF